MFAEAISHLSNVLSTVKIMQCVCNSCFKIKVMSVWLNVTLNYELFSMFICIGVS
jgi:hypothetical protein